MAMRPVFGATEYLPVIVFDPRCADLVTPVSRVPHKCPTGPCVRTPAQSPQFARRAVVADHRSAPNADPNQPCGRSHRGSLHFRQDLRRRRPPVRVTYKRIVASNEIGFFEDKKPRHVQTAAARCSSQLPLRERREKAKYQSISRLTSAGLVLLQIATLTYNPVKSGLKYKSSLPDCQVSND